MDNEILSDSEQRAKRKVELQQQAEERAVSANELLGQRRLLKADRRELCKRLTQLNTDLSWARSHKDSKTAHKLQGEVDSIMAEIAEIDAKIDALESQLSQLMRGTAFGAHLVMSMPAAGGSKL